MPPLTGGLRHPYPRCDVPSGRRALHDGEPLEMTPASGRVAEPEQTHGPQAASA